jgi:hypothetical protein
LRKMCQRSSVSSQCSQRRLIRRLSPDQPIDEQIGNSGPGPVLAPWVPNRWKGIVEIDGQVLSPSAIPEVKIGPGCFKTRKPLVFGRNRARKDGGFCQ